MKLTELLKSRGLFSADIRQRLSNGQIKINGDVIKQDVDLSFSSEMDLGDFISELCKNNVWCKMLKLFGIETLIEGSNIDNDLTRYLSNYTLLQYSKKESVILGK